MLAPLPPLVLDRTLESSPEMLQAIWAGDDAEALRARMETARAELGLHRQLVGIDSIMLSQRLHRPRSAWALFEEQFKALMPPDSAMAPSGGTATHMLDTHNQPHMGYCAQTTHRLFGVCIILVHAAVAGHYETLDHVLNALHQELKRMRAPLALWPQRCLALDDWLRAAILGRLLSSFTQDSLLKGSGHCRMLSDAADELGCALNNEHAFIHFKF